MSATSLLCVGAMKGEDVQRNEEREQKVGINTNPDIKICFLSLDASLFISFWEAFSLGDTQKET